MLRAGGAGLSDEQREEMTNREGVASGGATYIFIVLIVDFYFYIFSTFAMKISAILAVGKGGEIGLNGGLPWRSKGDMQHFKNLTSEHCILMGMNTYNSIGRPLPKRTNIVITSKNIQLEGCHVFHSVEDGIKFAESHNENELFIIGGLSIYKYCQEKGLLDRIYLTKFEY